MEIKTVQIIRLTNKAYVRIKNISISKWKTANVNKKIRIKSWLYIEK